MSRLSRQLAHLADELDQERARHAEVIRKLAAQDRLTAAASDLYFALEVLVRWVDGPAAPNLSGGRALAFASDLAGAKNILAFAHGEDRPDDRFEIVPGERILASFDDVSQRTEVIREGDRVCLQCFKPIAGAKPYPASGPAYCQACEATR